MTEGGKYLLFIYNTLCKLYYMSYYTTVTNNIKRHHQNVFVLWAVSPQDKKTKQKTFHFHENTWGMTYLCNNQTHQKTPTCNDTKLLTAAIRATLRNDLTDDLQWEEAELCEQFAQNDVDTADDLPSSQAWISKHFTRMIHGS